MRQPIPTPAQALEILRARRRSKGLAQAELAAKLGISQGRFSTLEANPGGMTLDRFLLLAKLLDLEVVLQDRSEGGSPKVDW